MIPTSVREVAAAVGGTLVDVVDPDQVIVTSCVSDSRQAVPGALFVALSGARVDGHQYAVAAQEAGAVAVLSSRPVGVASVVVDDVLLALGRLARAQLARLPHVTVVGITGSAGKTTTKDLIAALLEADGPTIAPPGSFNNELGLPLTVLRATPDTRYLVLEMGARGRAHHIDYSVTSHRRISVSSSWWGVPTSGSSATASRSRGPRPSWCHALPADGIADARTPTIRPW